MKNDTIRVTGRDMRDVLTEALRRLRVESVTLRRVVADRDDQPRTRTIEYLPDEFVGQVVGALLLDPGREEDAIACHSPATPREIWEWAMGATPRAEEARDDD